MPLTCLFSLMMISLRLRCLLYSVTNIALDINLFTMLQMFLSVFSNSSRVKNLYVNTNTLKFKKELILWLTATKLATPVKQIPTTDWKLLKNNYIFIYKQDPEANIWA